MDFKLLLLLCCVVVSVNCKSKVLRDQNGELSSEDGGSFIISIPTGKTIAFRIDELDLRNSGSLKVKDLKTKEQFQFLVSRNRLYRKDKSGRREVTLPVDIEITSKKLKVTVKKWRSFAARYAAFVQNENMCRKSYLTVASTNISSCSNSEIIPTAETCDVIVQCPTNRVQEGSQVTCVGGVWTNMPSCQLDQNVLERCSFDFDTTEPTLVVPGCPFNVLEIARYYVDNGVSLDDELSPIQRLMFDTPGRSLTRSSGRSVNCAQICSKNTRGWIVNCSQPKNKRVHVKCLICRVYNACGKQTVIF